MFGFWQKPQITDQISKLEVIFDEHYQKIMKTPELDRTCIAVGVSTAWRMLNANFGSAEGFMREPLTNKHNFVEKVQEMADAMLKRGDDHCAVGMTLATMYFSMLAAVSESNGSQRRKASATLNRMADRLEPLNKLGWDFSPT
jgi:hypothetical protein